MPIKVKCLEPFKILYNLPEGTNVVILIGGRGGSKTYEASKWIAFQSAIKKKRCAILRDEKSLIRESILNEVLLRYDTANGSGILDQSCQKLETGIKDRSTNEMLVFTKGFRASTTEKKANLKSISNVDYAIIEEGEDIRDVDKFNTFADSIRNENSVIVIILNTPDIQHWILKRYFNLEQVEDGYFNITPKNIPGLVVVKTSFEDNPFLPEHIKSNYRGYGDVKSHLYNKFHYMTAILGYASTGRKGQVITKAKPISLKDYMDLPFKEVYGQDFGTASPAALIGVKFDGNKCYAREINYKPMNALQLGILYCELGFNQEDRIIADYADAEAVRKLMGGFGLEDTTQDILDRYPQLKKGFHIVKCIKPKPKQGSVKSSITFAIDIIDRMDLYVVEESTNFWNEIMNYCYAQDKYGNYTSDPEDVFNHAIDDLRYIVYDRTARVGLQYF